MNTRGFTYFAWLNPSNAGRGFMASYTDREGEHKFLSRGTDTRGSQLFRRFKFSPARRTISIPNSQTDVIEFLRDYPDCVGSPNGRYAYDQNGNQIQVGAVYKEVNEGKDAKQAIEATKLVAKAMNHALALEDVERAEELREMSVMTGFYKNDPGLQHFYLLEYAKNQPNAYLELAEDPTRRAKYIIKNGLHGESGVLKKKGFMIYWENIHLGNTEDDAVQAILADKELMGAIEQAINKAGQ